MNSIKLSDFIRNVPNGIGLFIGADMFSKKKKFLVGQPQLAKGHYALGDTEAEALDTWLESNKVYVTFPTLVVEYDGADFPQQAL